ncbi:MAG: pyridoxal phosphate-dependent aminotransferase [Longimicrobiales bacterium]
MRTSPNVAGIESSATLAVAAIARDLKAAGVDILDLSAGEPDFDTPVLVSEAGIQAIRAGKTRYTPVAGIPELRSAIARDLSRAHGVDARPAEVVVSNGAKQSLFNACFVLFGPGDRVLVPAPYWPSYPDIIRLARAEPVLVRGPEDRGFKIGPSELEAVRDASTRGLLLNSPCNPSGVVYTLDELEAIVAWAGAHDIAVVSDEIYSRICFTDPRAPGVLDVQPDLEPRNVVVSGASKSYAMTGWRIGYTYAGAELTAAMTSLQSHTTANASSPAQYAAVAAFSDPAELDVQRMREAFHGRRDLVVARVAALLPDAHYIHPEGAFYLFFRADDWYGEELSGSVALCQRLIEEAGVALVPGVAFGDDRYVRLSFAAADSVLDAAITRIAETLARIPAARAG